jgi:proline iminopeptidase
MTSSPQSYQSGHLSVKNGHKIFYAQFGNPQGVPVLSLHGGPGSQSKPKHVAGFDLEKYRLITFDQRGCGQSLPFGEINNNTTNDLIADIESLREHLGIQKWFVKGGSWGSALALVYAQAHPTVINGLLLSSIFLVRSIDNRWVFSDEGGAAYLFPDLWEKFQAFLQEHRLTDKDPAKVASQLLAKLISADEQTAREMAAGVNNWEGNLMSAQQATTYASAEEITAEHINYAKIYLHYQSNNFFLKENQIIKDIEKIKSLPAVLVHGRYDLLCPLDQMWQLKKRLPKAKSVILPTSNHALTADGQVACQMAFNWFLSETNTTV